MKSIVKWMALVAIFATAGKYFMDYFLPEYEAWREKFPPEPDPDDEELDPVADASVVPASDLFKPDAETFLNEGKEVNNG
jgi:hypothetical protein